MKRNLLIAGALILLAILGVGSIVVIQLLRPEVETTHTIRPRTEPIALLPRNEVKQARRIEAPPAMPKKIEARIELKQEEKPEPEEKAPEPKVEAKVEPKRIDKRPASTKVIVIGDDIKLNDPDGAYTLKTINGGDRIVIQGKIKTLTVAGLNDKSALDTTLLVADEIAFTGNLNSGASVLLGKTKSLRLRDINDKSTLDASASEARTVVLAGAVNSGSIVKLHAPIGNVEFLGEINDGSRVEVIAPDGKVVFKGRGDSVINGDAQVSIVARDVELRGAVNGAKTRLDITLSQDGSLQFNRLNGSVRLHYRKADARDPEPRVTAGLVGERAEFRKVAPGRE